MQKNKNGHKEHFDGKKVKYIGLLSFIFGFTDAFFTYVLSTYFAELIGSDDVGGFYFITFVAVFVLLWNLHRLIRRVGGSIRSFLLFLVFGITLSASLSLLPIGWVGAILVSLLLLVVNIAWATLDVILEEHSEDGVTGRIRGLHLTILNAGFLIAPFLSTRVIDMYGFSGIFFCVTLGLSTLLASSMLMLRNGHRYDTARLQARVAWHKMLLEKDLLNIYCVSFGLEFFYWVMVVYTPIHLRNLGFGWDDIGILFTVMLLPFVFLQYPLGVLADKRFGEKEFLVGSIVIAMIAAFAIGLYRDQNFFIWGTLLFLSRVGAAGIEILRDAYFYKQIDGDDKDLIAFFRTTRPLANIVGAAITIPILAILPFHWIFSLAAAVLFGALSFALRLKDTPAEAELAKAR